VTAHSSLIAVDIGNARIKLGRFCGDSATTLPAPDAALQLDGDAPPLDQITAWLAGLPATVDQPARDGLPPKEFSWWIGSVNRPATTRLLDWLREHRPQDRLVLLGATDLPLEVRVDRPDMVGIDRLLDAVAANRLREPHRPAALVDVGTAITVDWVAAEGMFCGGAILPGIGMSARALHEFTDLLPLVEMSELATPPPALGTATVPAIRSGLFWGAVGAIRELVAQLAHGLGEPQIFLTGGGSPAVSQLLGPNAQYVPQLTLAGIALSAQAIGNRLWAGHNGC
jgi:type III pantothenate kinase